MTMQYAIHALILAALCIAIVRTMVRISQIKKLCKEIEAEINEAKS